MNNLRLIFTLLILSTLSATFAQENSFSKNSIKTGLKLAVFSGNEEEGVGAMLYLGYQKNYGRFRLTPEIAAGTFRPLATDTRDQYFRVNSVALNGTLDLIKLNSFSIFAGIGTSISYSRGLIGTGGYRDIINESGFDVREDSYYFNKLYAAGSGHFGFRFSPSDSPVAYDLSIINVALGTNRMDMEYLSFGIDFKLKTRKKK